MKLFNKIPAKVSAFILLFSFLGIYMINFCCTVGNLTHDLNWFAVQEHHHSNHTTTNDKPPQSKEHDDCCNNNANVFFASIQALIPQSDIHFISMTNHFSMVSFSIIDANINRYLNLFIKTKPPPLNISPKFADTRIFIQSFQI